MTSLAVYDKLEIEGPFRTFALSHQGGEGGSAMINLVLIKKGNPSKNTATSQVFIPCLVRSDTSFAPLVRVGWGDWDSFYFEVKQDKNSICNGYGIIYFVVPGGKFQLIGSIAENDRIVARFGKKVFYSLFVHASGAVAIVRYSLDFESKKLCVNELRPRAYFNNLTDEVVSLRQLQKENVNLPTPVLVELARRIVHLGSLITKRIPVVSRETTPEETGGKLLNFQEALTRRAEINI